MHIFPVCIAESRTIEYCLGHIWNNKVVLPVTVYIGYHGSLRLA